MGQMVIKYDTLSLSQQVLERQEGHAQQIATYLPANADIGDSTGLLLSVFDPLSELAVRRRQRRGARARRARAGHGRARSATPSSTSPTSDGQVGDAFSKLIGRLGMHGADPSYPDLGGPTLPAAGEGAPDGYGDVESFFWEKNQATAEALSGQHQRRQRADRPGRPVGLDRPRSPS